jgi:hypothetical protein
MLRTCIVTALSTAWMGYAFARSGLAGRNHISHECHVKNLLFFDFICSNGKHSVSVLPSEFSNRMK